MTQPTSQAQPAMPAIADLEIAIHKRGTNANEYSVELRFRHPGSSVPVHHTAQATIDCDQLRAHVLDPQTYGSHLWNSLFADGGLLQHIAHARSTALALNQTLRLRLFISESATELHTLHWETLRNPFDGMTFAINETFLFSRYLDSQDWQHIALPARPMLNALVAIANPSDISVYEPEGQKLAPLDVPAEYARASTALADVAHTFMVSHPSFKSGSDRLPTLDNLIDHLRTDSYHILYIVAHGALAQDGPRIWLENNDGTADVIPASTLVTRIAALRQRPLLVVLASCQSGSSSIPTTHQINAASDAHTSMLPNVQAALSNTLARAGIPAVLSMQGHVTMDTLKKFMPTFFREVQRTGQIDHAVAVARGRVSDRPDWWMPALFVRVENGRLWNDQPPPAVEHPKPIANKPDQTSHTPETAQRKAQVFVCYAPADKKQARKLYARLDRAGLKPWMDSEDILGGQVRDSVIKQAVRESDFLIVCLTKQAVSQPGPFHKTLKLALDVWLEKPEGHLYLIPVCLEACTLPASLSGFQEIDLFEDDGWSRLIQTLGAGITRLGSDIVQPSSDAANESGNQNVTPAHRDTALHTTTASPPPGSRLAAIKRENLNNQLRQLEEEYRAVHNQYSYTLDESNKVRLKRQIDHLEKQMELVEAELRHV